MESLVRLISAIRSQASAAAWSEASISDPHTGVEASPHTIVVDSLHTFISITSDRHFQEEAAISPSSGIAGLFPDPGGETLTNRYRKGLGTLARGRALLAVARAQSPDPDRSAHTGPFLSRWRDYNRCPVMTGNGSLFSAVLAKEC